MSMMPLRLAPDAWARTGSAGRPERSAGLKHGPDVASLPVAMPLRVEAHDADAMEPFVEAWTGLARRALEPDAFMEPGFCLSAARHLRPARRPVFVLVWSVPPEGEPALLAVCPMIAPGLPVRRIASSWFHDLAALGGPLLDRDHAAAAVEAVLAWIAGRYPGCGAWLVRALPSTGATAQVIEAAAARMARPVQRLDPSRRAVLGRAGSGEPAGLDALSRKKAKEVRRQRRRLAEQGALGYESVSAGEGLSDALERFLRLEAKGWKGRRGTALLCGAEQAAFARAMVGLMARHGRCRIDSLTLDGRPVAMGIVLSSGERDYFWKMAYDEDHAASSPGVLFVLALTERQRGDARLEQTDSCALPDHPMIDHLWRGRLDLADLLVAVKPGAGPGFRALALAERARRHARARLKRWVLGLRARMPARRPPA